MNRRGFAPYALCKKCVKVYSCPNCSINLVYHKGKNILLCHYCGYKSKLNRSCSKGNTCDFVFSGPGVERIAEEVKILFPDKKIRQIVEDRIQAPFIATAEQDTIIYTILDLEQYIGKKIDFEPVSKVLLCGSFLHPQRGVDGAYAFCRCRSI